MIVWNGFDIIVLIILLVLLIIIGFLYLLEFMQNKIDKLFERRNKK